MLCQCSGVDELYRTAWTSLHALPVKPESKYLACVCTSRRPPKQIMKLEPVGYCGKCQQLHRGKGAKKFWGSYHTLHVNIMWSRSNWQLIHLKISALSFFPPTWMTQYQAAASNSEGWLEKTWIWICVVPTAKYRSRHLFWNSRNVYTVVFEHWKIAYSTTRNKEKKSSWS